MKPEFSELESKRFDLRVFRASSDDLDERALFQSLLEQRADLLILRLPSPAGKAAARMNRFGVEVTHADTLVYYDVDLAAYEPKPLRNPNISFVEATNADVTTLDTLVDEIFIDYKSHYHASPLLPPAQILAGYKEWARNHIANFDHRHITWIVRDGTRLLGFCCCAFDTANAESEGVLYGILPDAAGGGLYGDMIRYTQAHFKANGFRHMKVSTQVHNYAVQKVWTREGFSMKQALDTFHVTCLFNRSMIEPVIEPLMVEPADVARYAELSGDFNPVHFDDDAARAGGFSGRISHGMLYANWLSRHFGTVVPGNGTIFLKNTIVFMKPVYPGVGHHIFLRFPVVQKNGFHKAVSELRDAEGEVCAIAFCDLIRRT
ncbi:MAG: GNAT family N-acetyltransferase [Dokdonella sp.]